MARRQRSRAWLGVEKAHGTFGTDRTKRQNHFVRFCNNGWKCFEFWLGKIAENVVTLLSLVECISDTNPKTRILLAVERELDIFKAVVACRTSLCSQA